MMYPKTTDDGRVCQCTPEEVLDCCGKRRDTAAAEKYLVE